MGPPPRRCVDRERLLDELKSVNAELNTIHDAEIAAGLLGNLKGFKGLQPRLETVRERRVAIVDRLTDHMRNHCC